MKKKEVSEPKRHDQGKEALEGLSKARQAPVKGQSTRKKDHHSV